MAVGRARSEASRRAILLATRDELTEQGYDRLSIDRIATAAGVGKQTIYRWYPSKSELVADCLVEGYIVRPILTTSDTGDVRRDITAWIEAFAEQSRVPAAASLTRAITAAAAENTAVAAHFQEQVRVTQDVLVGRLRAGIEAGQLRPGTAVATVAETIVGALLYRILTRQDLGDAFVADLADLVFAGVLDSRG
ncbi:TetR/AcrR family transcriptional regulator [Curtobacterium sp. VKM Ac-2887]|uniref:TetR/AcrR family transcriptional regulator n=1 Tax=Curtobacterium sp. VKM Ac-2887 TaxID=2783819 RepID=UPI00188BA86A|nr:TetR/AcrR family transcriptional regulator [Curtobacterium sp. VKM Ac-2887]MBF4588359.1 TetR/AcrR family transcriptional regulator [Curtobacterium sp. VKM Ac-2887]